MKSSFPSISKEEARELTLRHMKNQTDSVEKLAKPVFGILGNAISTVKDFLTDPFEQEEMPVEKNTVHILKK